MKLESASFERSEVRPWSSWCASKYTSQQRAIFFRLKVEVERKLFYRQSRLRSTSGVIWNMTCWLLTFLGTSNSLVRLEAGVSSFVTQGVVILG